MRATPNAFAAWIIQRTLSFDFEGKPDAERVESDEESDPVSISLRLRLEEDLPDHFFLNLRVELLVPVVDPEQIEDAERREEVLRAEGQYSKIFLAVQCLEAEPGTKPEYVLHLTPIGRGRGEQADFAKRQDNRDGLLTLADQMSRTAHPERRGERLEWRNGFSLVRLYHARYPSAADRVELPNPRYVPVIADRLRGLIARLPTGAPREDGAREDDEEIDRLLASADDAFADPSTKPRARHDSFGYDVYLIHGQDFEEFDLDKAILVALREHEAA